MSRKETNSQPAPLYYYRYRTPVGQLTVVATCHAVTAILFTGESLPSGAVEQETELISRMGAELQEYFAGTRRTFETPIFMEGTPFQISVWKALCAIPYGETRSYKDIAVAIGRPLACRAVGMANNRNRLPFVIPCHRVIGANGTLIGYAGGLNIKQQLLELEQAL